MTADISSAPRFSPLWGSLLLALLVELAVLAGAMEYLERAAPAPEPPKPEPIALQLAPPQEPAPLPPTEAAKPAVPKPTAPARQSPRNVPQRPRAAQQQQQKQTEQPEKPEQRQETEPVPAVVEKLDDAPSSFATPSAPAVPPPPPVAATATATPTDLFQAALRAAVQAAVRYPGAARIMKLTGQTRLGFDYRDGLITNPRVVRSSDYEMLDKAALDALRNAAFPTPPKELSGQTLKLEIIVVFSLQS